MDTKTYLNHYDNVYYALLGIDNKGSGLGKEYWEFKKKHPQSIASEMDGNEPDRERQSCILGGMKSLKSDTTKYPYKTPAQKRCILSGKVRSGAGASRSRNHAAWLADMEKIGLYCTKRIAEVLGIHVEKIEYATDKKRLYYEKMGGKSSATQTRMIKLEDAQEWLRLDALQREAIERGSGFVWATLMNGKRNNIKFSEDMT